MSNTSRDDLASGGKAIEWIFFQKWEDGLTDVEFETPDFDRAFTALELPPLQHKPDLIYRFKTRGSLPQSIQETAPPGYSWLLKSVGRSKYARYAFSLVSDNALQNIVADPQLAETKIPLSTPSLIDRYVQTDEQAILAIVRYNRLLDIFTGVSCYSLQNHFKSTLASGTQVELDEIYLGVDQAGAHYVLPVEAKTSGETLTAIQVHQSIRLVEEKFPGLLVRPIGAQKLSGDAEPPLIALFELTTAKDGQVKKVREKHFRLVPATEITAEDLAEYKRHLRDASAL